MGKTAEDTESAEGCGLGLSLLRMMDRRGLDGRMAVWMAGAGALGALAVGAVAVGALAIGALAIGRLAVGRARVRRLEIDELVVRRLRITEEWEVPSRAGGDKGHRRSDQLA